MGRDPDPVDPLQQELFAELADLPSARQSQASQVFASLGDSLRSRGDGELAELHEFWARGEAGSGQLRLDLERWMSDGKRAAESVEVLGKRLGAVLEILLAAPGYGLPLAELSVRKELAYLNGYDLEACLTALERRGFVVSVQGKRFDQLGQRLLALPRELAEGVLRERRARRRGIFDLVTLRGFLDRMYSDPARAARTNPARVRELYKLYSAEAGAVARIERLPEGLRELVEKAILEFGGILPKSLFERTRTGLSHWNGRRWQQLLEQSLVGTVQQLELSRYGIQHADDTLVVFNEVALAWLRKRAVPSDPDRPHEELSLGVDQITNVARFLAYIQENEVRYTVRGEIFKTTEKKILQHLIPNPGRELEREQVLEFIYEFCRKHGLLDGSGERTLAATSDGRSWGSRTLPEKIQALLDYAIEEQGENGEPFHQARLRRLLLRMLKRIEPGVWYDLMYLPFLARNQYLASLEDLRVEERFAEDTQAGVYHPFEDCQRLAWNLVRWARQRLYLLGIIDLGYDSQKRPVAMRLAPHGARLLGLDPERERTKLAVGSLIVTPTFEVVLFKSGDDAELMHELDRFAVRERGGETVVFRIEEASVRRALVEGMGLDQLLLTLESNSRTPVPQNVSFSIRDWARRAGRMVLDEALVLSCEEEDALRRLRQDPGVRGYIAADLDEKRVQLKGRITPKRMRALLRDLGYLVELVAA
jgi:hypothetical protein